MKPSSQDMINPVVIPFGTMFGLQSTGSPLDPNRGPIPYEYSNLVLPVHDQAHSSSAEHVVQSGHTDILHHTGHPTFLTSTKKQNAKNARRPLDVCIDS